MTEDNKDMLAFQGLAVMGLTALAGLQVMFGIIGVGVGISLFMFPASRAVMWMNAAKRLRRYEEPPASPPE